MKISLIKKICALGLAATMTVPLALSACNNGNKGDSDEWVITLNYNDEGESYNKELYVDKTGGEVKKPKDPSRTGYEFDGWYTAADGTGTEVNWDSLNVTEDVTLYAHWAVKTYPVTFDWNFAGSTPQVEYVNYKQSVTNNDNGVSVPATVPQNGDKRFIGWGASSTSKAPDGDLSRPIKRQTTYYGFWINKDTDIFTVEYDLSYSDAAEIVASTYYSDISDPIILPAPVREGYDFRGWTVSSAPVETGELGAYASFSPITSDGTETAEHEYKVTLHAVWEIKKWDIEFINYNGQILKTLLKREYNSQITEEDKPADPVRDHCEFLGWYTLRTGGEKVEFPYTVKNGNALYARFQSELVESDIFDAEFVVIDPSVNTPGYSGDTTTGYGRILQDGLGTFGATTQHAEYLPDYEKELAYYASYLYQPDFALTFTIECSEATSATLVLRAALESVCGAEYTFSSTAGAENCYEININGTSFNYKTFTVEADSFADINLGTIRLNKGTNVIKLITANSTTSFGGTTKAVAPIIDCIKIKDHGSAKLSWRPEYDNLNNR